MVHRLLEMPSEVTGVEATGEEPRWRSPVPAKERSVKDNESSASCIAAQGRMTSSVSDATLSPADKTAALTTVRYLEGELFGDSGHLRRGLSPDRAEKTVALINDLRRVLGWLEIDLGGRWRWPVTSDRGDPVTDRPSPRRRGPLRLGNPPRRPEYAE
jgi:hypothetical protein